MASSDLKEKKFHLDSVLNATSDGVAHVYILTGEGKLFTFDLKTGNEIGYIQLYTPNNISSTLALCDNKLFIHRMDEPEVLIYNITAKNDIRVYDNVSVCKQGSSIPQMFRYHIQCGGSFAHLLCGSGYGPTSEWKYGMYFLKTQTPPQQTPKQLIALGGVGVIIFLYVLNMYWKKKNKGKGAARSSRDDREE